MAVYAGYGRFQVKKAIECQIITKLPRRWSFVRNPNVHKSHPMLYYTTSPVSCHICCLSYTVSKLSNQQKNFLTTPKKYAVSRKSNLNDQTINLSKVTLNSVVRFFQQTRKAMENRRKKMVRNDCREIVKKEFDFGWKKTGGFVHPTDLLALEYQKGDILDIGCGTCRLYNFLSHRGWTGRYIGIDVQRHEGYPYPAGVDLIIADPATLTFPKTDTVVLYYLLEHVEDPCALLSKSIESCQENVLVCVPKRNEMLWQHGLAEFHQLDKTHQHCGFSKKEVNNIVRLSGGKIRRYKDVAEINATVGTSLWNSRVPRGVVIVLSKIFSSKTFYADIWCEIVKDD